MDELVHLLFLWPPDPSAQGEKYGFRLYIPVMALPKEKQVVQNKKKDSVPIGEYITASIRRTVRRL